MTCFRIWREIEIVKRERKQYGQSQSHCCQWFHMPCQSIECHSEATVTSNEVYHIWTHWNPLSEKGSSAVPL